MMSRRLYYRSKGWVGRGFPADWVAGKDGPCGGRLMTVLIEHAAVGDSPDRASFAELETRAQLYDPEILAVVRDCFLGENAPKDDAAAQEVVKVSAARLKAGARLASDIETEDGWLVLAAGHEI